jgi:hypothetical protein
VILVLRLCILVVLAVLAASVPARAAELCAPPTARSWTELFDLVAADTERIQPLLPQRLARLDIDWARTRDALRERMRSAAGEEDSLRAVATLVAAAHDTHRGHVRVDGTVWREHVPATHLPIRVIGVGTTLDRARFFVESVERPAHALGVRRGMEIVRWRGVPIDEIKRAWRDTLPVDNPAGLVDGIARRLWLRRGCAWIDPDGCWRVGATIDVDLRGRGSRAQRFELPVMAGEPAPRYSGAAPAELPPGMSFALLEGAYAPRLDGEGAPGFLAELRRGTRRVLVLKLREFAHGALFERFESEARSGRYERIVLDFSENVGGDLSAYRLLAIVLGNGFWLDRSATPLIDEYACAEHLDAAALFDESAAVLRADLAEGGRAVSRFMPFICPDGDCGRPARYREMMGVYGKARERGVAQIVPTALITGTSTASMADLFAATFAAHRAGPIVGVSPRASSARFAFTKRYVVAPPNGRRRTIDVRYTPTISLLPDCTVMQLDALQPDVPVARTLRNSRSFDVHSWSRAIDALRGRRAGTTEPRCSDTEVARGLADPTRRRPTSGEDS